MNFVLIKVSNALSRMQSISLLIFKKKGHPYCQGIRKDSLQTTKQTLNKLVGKKIKHFFLYKAFCLINIFKKQIHRYFTLQKHLLNVILTSDGMF